MKARKPDRSDRLSAWLRGSVARKPNNFRNWALWKSVVCHHPTRDGCTSKNLWVFGRFTSFSMVLFFWQRLLTQHVRFFSRCQGKTTRQKTLLSFAIMAEQRDRQKTSKLTRCHHQTTSQHVAINPLNIGRKTVRVSSCCKTASGNR